MQRVAKALTRGVSAKRIGMGLGATALVSTRAFLPVSTANAAPTPQQPHPLGGAQSITKTLLDDAGIQPGQQGSFEKGSSRQTLSEVIQKNPATLKSALSPEEFQELNTMTLDKQKQAMQEAKERLETEYIVNTLARRDGLAAGSQTVQLTKKDIEKMQQYQSSLVMGNKQVHAYESSFISPVPHMIYEPAPAGEFFIWPNDIETLALYLVNEAGYELLRKPWHPNRFISGRNHLYGREEYELYGRTCPSHPTRPKALPHLPFIDDRLKQHPAIPQEKHVSTVFGIVHCGPFTEALVQDYIDEGLMMSILNRVSHSTLLLNNVTGRPESTAFHFKRMPNPGEAIFISATLEYSANKDKALVCAAVFDSDIDASYMDAKAVFKIMKSTDFDQAELELIDKQTLPSLQILKQDLKMEQQLGSSAMKASSDAQQQQQQQQQGESKGFFGGLLSAVTGK